MNDELSLPSDNTGAGNIEQTGQTVEGQADNGNQGYEHLLNRFNHTHGELRSVKSQLAERDKEMESLRSKADEAYNFINRFQQPKELTQSDQFWQDGVEKNFYGLKDNLSQFQEQAIGQLSNVEVELAAMKLKEDIDNLYDEKGKSYGFESKKDFREFLGSQLEKIDPNWGNAYFQHKGKALQTYMDIIEARNYNNAESPIYKAHKQKIEQEVMQKLSTRLGKNLSNIDLETGRPKSSNPYSSGVI